MVRLHPDDDKFAALKQTQYVAQMAEVMMLEDKEMENTGESDFDLPVYSIPTVVWQTWVAGMG